MYNKSLTRIFWYSNRVAGKWLPLFEALIGSWQIWLAMRNTNHIHETVTRHNLDGRRI